MLFLCVLCDSGMLLRIAVTCTRTYIQLFTRHSSRAYVVITGNLCHSFMEYLGAVDLVHI